MIMPIDYRQFIHPTDAKALEALRKIPGFTALSKKIMEIFSERMKKIETMSSYIRLGPDQMPEVYNLLPPICEKLGIPEPEMYVKLDRVPNAYTTGDTQVFIVIHSGLLETMSLDEVQTVLAHECGHILCRHVLFQTMGSYLLNASDYILSNFGLLKYASTALMWGFYHWMRCSEYSADRVSAYFSGGHEKVTDVMLKLSGATNNLPYQINKEHFIQQAADYRDQMKDSTVNKIFELYMIKENSHPFTAMRALEIKEWCESDAFNNINGKEIDKLPSKLEKKTHVVPPLGNVEVDEINNSAIKNWFKDKDYLGGEKKLATYLKISSEEFDNKVNKYKENGVYVRVVSKDGFIVAHAVITFKRMEAILQTFFTQNKGTISY